MTEKALVAVANGVLAHLRQSIFATIVFGMGYVDAHWLWHYVLIISRLVFVSFNGTNRRSERDAASLHCFAGFPLGWRPDLETLARNRQRQFL